MRNAQLTLTVSNVEQEIAFVRSAATAAGGQVIDSSTSYNGTEQVASLSVEVPSAQFDGVMTTLRGGKLVRTVEREVTTSQDVTDQYVDLQAELSNDQATLQRYLALQQQATSMSDILAIEQQISRVQGEVDQLQGRITFLDHTTTYSQIALTLQPVGVPPAPSPAPNLEQSIANAWAASLRFVGRAAGVVVTAVVFLWWFWLLVVAGWAGVAMVRSRRRREAGPSGGMS